MNKSKTKKENNSKSNLRTEIHRYSDRGDNSSQNESIENSSEDKFDWDWIFEKGWLKTKK